MMKKLLFAVALLAFSCSNSEMETLKKANEELATENVKLKAENKAMEAQLVMAKMFAKKETPKEEYPEPNVSENMHDVQQIAIQYWLDKGAFPGSLEAMQSYIMDDSYSDHFKHMSMGGDISNPIQGGTWFTDGNGLKLGTASKGCNPGETYYQPMSKQGDKYMNFAVTGCEADGSPTHEPGDASSVMVLTKD